MIRIQLVLGFICSLLVLISCGDKNRIYEQNIDIQENNWRIEDTKEFKFEITDTTQVYNIYFNIRNALIYEYYNLYVSQTLINPAGEKISTKLHELYLMDKKTGEPLGKGAGDIFDHSVLALKKQQFSTPGTYTLRLTQYMRKNPLPGIMAVGVKVAIAK